jgi:multisubunit Na+/H+ antiporter MnhG subunit
MNMHEEIKDELVRLEENYSQAAFLDIVKRLKKERINDDELLEKIETISQRRFKERVSFTLSVTSGNIFECALTIAAIALVFWVNSIWMLYVSVLVLMATLHPLSHYLIGGLVGIRFTHYYLNGPARVEPTLRIDYFSYLKISGKKRALMHVSGVIGTVMAPLFVLAVAIYKGANEAAMNLFILFVLLIVFELLTSTKIGDLMKAKREYGFK